MKKNNLVSIGKSRGGGGLVLLKTLGDDNYSKPHKMWSKGKKKIGDNRHRTVFWTIAILAHG